MSHLLGISHRIFVRVAQRGESSSGFGSYYERAGHELRADPGLGEVTCCGCSCETDGREKRWQGSLLGMYIQSWSKSPQRSMQEGVQAVQQPYLLEFLACEPRFPYFLMKGLETYLFFNFSALVTYGIDFAKNYVHLVISWGHQCSSLRLLLWIRYCIVPNCRFAYLRIGTDVIKSLLDDWYESDFMKHLSRCHLSLL